MKTAAAVCGVICVVLLNGCATSSPSDKANIRFLGADFKSCKPGADCITDVTIRKGDCKPAFGDGGECEKYIPDGCHIEWDYKGYVVEKEAKPWLKWNLVDQTPPLSGRINFDTNDGIKLNPDDKNDPGQDLANGQIEGSKGFKWQAVNKRPRENDPDTYPGKGAIRFNFVVIRRYDNYRCGEKDPVIINKGE